MPKTHDSKESLGARRKWRRAMRNAIDVSGTEAPAVEMSLTAAVAEIESLLQHGRLESAKTMLRHGARRFPATPLARMLQSSYGIELDDALSGPFQRFPWYRYMRLHLVSFGHLLWTGARLVKLCLHLLKQRLHLLPYCHLLWAAARCCYLLLLSISQHPKKYSNKAIDCLRKGKYELAIRYYTKYLFRTRDICRKRYSADTWRGIQKDLLKAHGLDLLAEEAINRWCDFASAVRLYEMKRSLQRDMSRALESAPGKLLWLSEDWVRNVGHIAFIDYWIKMQQLGWDKWEQIVLLAPKEGVANTVLVNYWKEHVTIVHDEQMLGRLTSIARGLGPRCSGVINIPGSGNAYFAEGIAAVEAEWERQKRPASLSLTESDVKRGRSCMEKMGVPRDAWFVGIHVRSPGFYGHCDILYSGQRNADISSYFPAIAEIARRGGWVVRLGDKSMQPLPELPNVIDYAHSRFKSDWMDVYLCGASRFFIGCASGISHVPMVFGVPSVLTNWISNAWPYGNSRDLFLPKLLVSKREKRRLSFCEMLSPRYRWPCYSGVGITSLGIQVVDNTAQEIRDVVVEMLDILDGRTIASEADQIRQQELRQLAKINGVTLRSRVGKKFLDANASLLAN